MLPLSPGQIETIARAIHEGYRRRRRPHNPEGDPSIEPWDGLADSLKDSNRALAAALPEKARTWGYQIATLNGPPSFPDADLERLARAEHERWVEERRAAGWTLAPVKDIERKRTPHLVPWEELSDEIRELDREAIRGVPEALAAVGLGLYPR
jgi:hypothetical protein